MHIYFVYRRKERIVQFTIDGVPTMTAPVPRGRNVNKLLVEWDSVRLSVRGR